MSFKVGMIYVAFLQLILLETQRPLCYEGRWTNQLFIIVCGPLAISPDVCAKTRTSTYL